MYIENITFENIDTPKDIAVKTALIYAGIDNDCLEFQNVSVYISNLNI